MNKVSILVTALALASVSSLAVAGHHGKGPSGFDNQGPGTVSDVLNSAYDDQFVVLQGRLTKYLGHDRYEFTDSTGTIEVELDDDRNWSHIAKDELIEIRGKFDDDFMDKKIDVKYAVSLERGPAAAVPHAAYPAQQR